MPRTRREFIKTRAAASAMLSAVGASPSESSQSMDARFIATSFGHPCAALAVKNAALDAEVFWDRLFDSLGARL